MHVDINHLTVFNRKNFDGALLNSFNIYKKAIILFRS
jgi:hypothetical protein